MGKGHRQFFLTLHSAFPQDKQRVVERIASMSQVVWYIVALEKYTDKEGYHIHLMFRVGNNISGQLLKKRWTQWWAKSDSDVFEQVGQGSFRSNVDYVTKVPVDEHKAMEQMDPDPVIWPTDYQETEVKRPFGISDAIAMIQAGHKYDDILQEAPEWVFRNGPRLRKFIIEYRKVMPYKPIPRPKKNNFVQEDLVDIFSDIE